MDSTVSVDVERINSIQVSIDDMSDEITSTMFYVNDDSKFILESGSTAIKMTTKELVSTVQKLNSYFDMVAAQFSSWDSQQSDAINGNLVINRGNPSRQSSSVASDSAYNSLKDD